MLVVYPAIFHKAIEGGYVVIFPDLNNGATQGETLEEAIEMAQDYIGTYLYDDFLNGKELPKASGIENIKINLEEEEKECYEENKSFTSLINLDMKKYVNECKSQTVRKNVSIPSWLNEMAKRSNINFSNILQEALKQELGID